MTTSEFLKLLEDLNLPVSSRTYRQSAGRRVLLVDCTTRTDVNLVLEEAEYHELRAERVAGVEWFGGRPGLRVAVYGCVNASDRVGVL